MAANGRIGHCSNPPPGRGLEPVSLSGAADRADHAPAEPEIRSRLPTRRPCLRRHRSSPHDCQPIAIVLPVFSSLPRPVSGQKYRHIPRHLPNSECGFKPNPSVWAIDSRTNSDAGRVGCRTTGRMRRPVPGGQTRTAAPRPRGRGSSRPGRPESVPYRARGTAKGRICP